MKVPIPAQIIEPPTSDALIPTSRQLSDIKNSKMIVTEAPLKPNSSPITANIKSVSASDMNYCS